MFCKNISTEWTVAKEDAYIAEYEAISRKYYGKTMDEELDKTKQAELEALKIRYGNPVIDWNARTIRLSGGYPDTGTGEINVWHQSGFTVGPKAIE
ncbi:hypothetical protein HP1_041 [Candidatus Termititenax spirochaetophilus]|uniref:Uncharacterized protein n=1 Tax=Candidatus Termititenax spirochaetophilus TaxID=2218522 RepID=A0A388T7K0_9BACT|nr:hypothetical protein HP1_041 [Candidatus Termititenax spirochaetophilus]